MQVDGYRLDAQKDKLKKYAEFQDMVVAGEYSDEGKSGKNIEGRPQFLQMLKDIESGKDKVEFVLVFKLSRFGRNAADVLSSLQRMQDFGVNLICVEDGIDRSKDRGKLMISVLSAVAEIERENILVQTIERTSDKRESQETMKDSEEIIGDIKEDSYLRSLWEVYLRENKYIGNLKFDKVVDVVRIISNRINEM